MGNDGLPLTYKREETSPLTLSLHPLRLTTHPPTASFHLSTHSILPPLHPLHFSTLPTPSNVKEKFQLFPFIVSFLYLYFFSSF